MIDNTYSTNVNCESLPIPTQTEVLIEFNNNTILTNKKVKTFCFCYYSLINVGAVATRNLALTDGSLPCKDWITMFLQANLLDLGVIICIPVINVVVGLFFKSLTNFERNKTVTSDITSLFFKFFFIQFINNVRIN